MKILVIGAHPADPIDLAGGTILKHAGNDDNIFVCSVTDGIRSHVLVDDGIVGDHELVQMKRDELEDALEYLSSRANVRFLGQFDEPLVDPQGVIVRQIANMIREIKPDIVITHHPNEYAHWDHANCGIAVCRALKTAIKLPGDNKWGTPMVYFFATQFRPESARIGYIPQAPDLLIALSADDVMIKARAMTCFKSQGLDNMGLMIQRMNSMESEMGRADGLRYSEGFTFYYPLKKSLLLPNAAISFYTPDKGQI